MILGPFLVDILPVRPSYTQKKIVRAIHTSMWLKIQRNIWQLGTTKHLKIRIIFTISTLKYFCTNHEDQRFFSTWNHHEWLIVGSFRFIWKLISWVYDHYKYLRGPSSYVESDVSRRQIRMYKDGLHAERVHFISLPLKKLRFILILRES